MNKSSNKKQMKRAKAKRIRLIVGVCCIAVLLVACGMIGVNIYRTQERLKMVSGLQNLYQSGGAMASAETVAPTPASEVPANPQTTGAAADDDDAASMDGQAATQTTTTEQAAFDENGNPVVQSDFAPLLEINEHLVGWLDATSDISLPIVHYDNEFYLNHDFYGNWDDAGTVFVNEVNTVWPADKHILLHGHNMRDGSAFGLLQENYSVLDTLKSNPIIYFRLINEAEPTAYVPVAIFEASVTKGNAAYFDIGHVFFDDDEEFVSYAESAVARSIYSLPVDVQADDHLLSLITCSYGYENARFIVMCRELRDGETVESVSQLMQQAAKK